MTIKPRLTACAVLALVGQVAAQQPVVTNPSFEQDDPSGNTNPLGWVQFNNALTVISGQSHTGTRSIKLTYGTSNFAAIWTSWPDSNNPENPFPYDPMIVYKGGAITVSGWYMIPAANALQAGSFTSLKLEVRRTVNGSTYMGFEWPVFGNTDGQWTYFERTVQDSEFLPYPLEPVAGQPTRCTILCEMFGPNGTDPISAVFWDDIGLTQATGPTCYANCDNSSVAPVLNANDFQCFLNKFAANDPYANCDGSTVAPILNANDFQCFLNSFAAGCR